FQTQLFAPYQRHTGRLEEAVIKMYQSGMSTREIGKFIERILGNAYSPATISRITDVVKEDIEKWHHRPLSKRYSVLYLDGLYVKLRRDTVEKEVIYVVLGVNEEGYREVLDFFVGGQECAYGWREILQQLYKRGVREVLLGTTGAGGSFSLGLSESRCAALCRAQSPQHAQPCSEKRSI